VHADSEDDIFYRALSKKLTRMPPHAQHDAALKLFSISLKRMGRASVVSLREDLHKRFPQCSGERDLGTVLLEIVEGHLALRDLMSEE
jgi:hypothetical protein